jgi:hypothetical protein
MLRIVLFVVASVLGALVLCSSMGPALAQQQGYTIFGTPSCARWLSNEQTKFSGNDWINGYMTARNFTNPRNRYVGAVIDFEGRIGEVEKICRDNPSMWLADAAWMAYEALERAGK